MHENSKLKPAHSNLGRTCCVQKLFLTFRTIFVHNTFPPCSAKRRVSDKNLPVIQIWIRLTCYQICQLYFYPRHLFMALSEENKQIKANMAQIAQNGKKLISHIFSSLSYITRSQYVVHTIVLH